MIKQEGEFMPQPKIGKKVFEERAERERPAIQESLDPEECALELLDWLPEHVRDKIVEAAKQMALPRWQMLLGYAMRMDEMGELFVPYILHSLWESSSTGKPSGIRICVHCQQHFMTRWPGAENCCNGCAFGKAHSEDCPVLESR